MKKPWRELEILISLIESALVPAGAVVKSPDKVEDLVTKKKREVDGSIRIQIGSVPILITIECRQRSKIDDVTWIEQLSKKKESLGAAKTLAVSKKGFSSEAIDLARREGIECRRIDDISVRDIKALVGLDGIIQTVASTELVGIKFGFYDSTDRFFRPTEEVRQQLVADGANAKVLWHEAFCQFISISQIVEAGKASGVDLHDVIPADGKRHRRVERIPVPPNTLRIATLIGDKHVREIEITLDLMVTKKPVTSVGFSYVKAESAVAHGLQGIVDMPTGEKIAVTVVREPNSREIRFSVSRAQKRGANDKDKS